MRLILAAGFAAAFAVLAASARTPVSARSADAFVRPRAGQAAPPSDRHFLLYDLTAGEGFNLRRDAMLRAAMLVSDLGPGWTLVLPPFHRMVHWAHDPSEELLPWRAFVDLSRLPEVLPVMEFDEFAAAHGRRVDRIVFLTSGPPPGSGYHIEPRACATIDRFTHTYQATAGGGFRAPFFGGVVPIDGARADCYWTFAPYSALEPVLKAAPDTSVLVDGMTMPFWNQEYGGARFWAIRTRLPFAKPLAAEADRFIRATFGGQPYLAVHLRRADFLVTARPHPTLDEVVAQLQALRQHTGLQQLFLATDSIPEEVAYLKARVPFSMYTPPPGVAYPDGSLAIFDQIIASRAAWFTGTANSTFTTTILEEREMLGKSPASTYNVLCTRAESLTPGAYDCPKPNRVALVR